MNTTTAPQDSRTEAEQQITIADGLRKFARDTAEHLIVRQQAGADSPAYYTAARDFLEHAMRYADTIDPRLAK